MRSNSILEGFKLVIILFKASDHFRAYSLELRLDALNLSLRFQGSWDKGEGRKYFYLNNQWLTNDFDFPLTR